MDTEARDRVYKAFERSFGKFWAHILREKDPQDMAREIEQRVWKLIGVIKATSGYEVNGYWTSQFYLLWEDVKNAGSYTRACNSIEAFRRCARNGEEYQRPPEDQRSVFNSPKWKSARDSVQVRP